MFVRHCRYCDYSTQKASTLSMHISMKHKKRNKHICPICRDGFSQKTQLEHHFVNQHCPADIPCLDLSCPVKFKTATNQQTHYIRKHMTPDLLYTASNTKGYKRCLSCPHIARTNSIQYHVAQCSPLSPFCTEINALANGDAPENSDDFFPDFFSDFSPGLTELLDCDDSETLSNDFFPILQN